MRRAPVGSLRRGRRCRPVAVGKAAQRQRVSRLNPRRCPHLCAFNGIRFDIPFLYKVWGLSLDRVECWVLKTFESLRSNATFSLNKLLASKGLESKSGTGIHVEVDVQLHKHAHCREAVANEAELLLPKLKVGALGVELLATEDLEHLRDVEQILPKRRRIRQAIVDKNKSAPFQRASSSWDPPVDQC